MATSNDQIIPDHLDSIERTYGRALKVFGATHRGVGWLQPDAQENRFKVLAELFGPDADQGGISVIDLGCGYGAMFEALQDQPQMQGSRYIGYDVSADMVAEARQRISDPRAEFHTAYEARENGDYSFVCGAYNMKLLNPTDLWRDYIEASLTQLWSKTRRGLAFNLLSIETPADEQDYKFYYGDAEDFAAFCRTALGGHVEIRSDYGPPEWTIFVRR